MRAGTLVDIARNVRSLLRFGVALSGLEGAMLLERFGCGRGRLGRVGMLALLRHICWLGLYGL